MRYRCFSPRRNAHLLSFVALAALALTGCRGPVALHTSFSQYSEAYANTQNEQMLLNLARRSNGHPPYFLQMGLINSTFSFSATAGGNMTDVRANNQIGPGIVTKALSGGGNLSLVAAEQPTFTFTPLAGTTFAQAIFTPISPVIFFSLLEQGRPVDQLMRTMVHSVDLTYVIATNRPTKTFSIRNILDVERQHNYRNFLRLAGIYRELQKAELLDIRSDKDGIGFKFRPGVAGKLADLQKDPAYQLEAESEWAVLHPEEVPTNSIPIVTIRLRTFEGVLTALATEYQTYDKVTKDPGLPIPASEREPVLRIDEGPGLDTSTRVVRVKYNNKHYQIADASSSSTWNRDVFSLLNYLFTQVSIDPNKLPVQQLIQVR